MEKCHHPVGSWYVERNLMSVVGEYENLDLAGKARADSVIYDPAPLSMGRKGRPAKHGRRLSIDSDFTLSAEKVDGYYTGYRRVLKNIFGVWEVMVYVTCTGKENGTRRLFFSAVFPAQLRIFLCMAGENAVFKELFIKNRPIRFGICLIKQPVSRIQDLEKQWYLMTF